MKIGHLYLSIFEIKKKVLKTKKLSIFSISLKLFDKKMKLQKHPRKTRNEISLVRKQELDFSRIF